MQAKTKYQQRIMALSNSLPRITEKQITWASENCLVHLAYRMKKNTCCLDCGYTWASNIELDGNVCKCGGCKRTLIVEDTKARTHFQHKIIDILQVVDGIQVVRTMEIKASYRRGEERTIRHCMEVMRVFIMPDGKPQLVGLAFSTSFYSGSFSGNMEIRNPQALDRYLLRTTAYYPEMEILPIYMRNGFTPKCIGFAGYTMLDALATNQRAETLWKAEQYGLFKGLFKYNEQGRINSYWNAVKICMRNNYHPAIINDWLDYLDLLDRYNKDLHNAHYVCPADLHAVHQYYVQMKRVEQQREREQDAELQRIKKEAAEKKRKFYHTVKGFASIRKPFFGLKFVAKNIEIVVLKSAKEFEKEGTLLQHCLYENAYYAKEESLVLSARIDGKPIETIEIILPTMEISQARGWDNKETIHHTRIVKLVSRNLPKIQKIYNSLKTA